MWREREWERERESIKSNQRDLCFVSQPFRPLYFLYRSYCALGVSEWVDSCLPPTQQLSSYIMPRTMRRWWGPLCSRPTLNIYSASSLKQQSRVDMSPHSDTLSGFRAEPVFALNPSCCVLSGEETHTNFLVFGLTRSELQLTIYYTRGEHANHYTTDVVYCVLGWNWMRIYKKHT